MGKIESVMREEIARLSKREIRASVDPLRKEVTKLRLRVSQLEKTVAVLDREAEKMRKAEVERLIAELRGQGMAILFISSELEEIVRDSQRVAVLRDRRKVGELAGDQVTEVEVMRLIALHEEDGQ